MALQGRHLKVAIGFWIPWCDVREYNGSLSVSGVAIDFFRIIAAQLNFTYSFVKEPNDVWGQKLANGSWTGMIGMCHRKEVDMAIGPFSVTYERSPYVDFSTNIHVDHYGIFLPRPKLEKDLSGFLKPLAWQVWVALAIFTGISMIIGYLMDHLLAGALKSKNTVENQEEKTFRPVWILRALVNEPAEKSPSTDTGRVFMGTWLLAALIIDTAYSGVLTSLLTIPTVSVPVNSLDDLVSYGKLPWAIEVGSALHQLFSEAKGGVYKKIFEGGAIVKSSFEEQERIKNGEVAVLSDVFAMKKIMNDDFGRTGKCHFYIAKNPIKSSPMAFAFPKGSSLTRHFNKWLGPLKESGLTVQSIESLTSNATACMVAPGKEIGNATSPFSVLDLAGIFLLVGAGLLLSLIALLAEKLICQLKRNT